MRDTDAAWLSGFIDGEAYVGLHPQRMKNGNKRTFYQVVVAIRHTHRESVERVVALLAELNIDVTVNIEERETTHKDIYRFMVSGMDRILRLADAVEPYTVTKREQWRVVREWSESRLAARPKAGYSEREEELALIGCAMNRRGKEN